MALRIVLGFVIATIFVISAVAGDSEEEPPPLEPVIREQTVVARSGAYRTRAAVGSIEHVNADVAVTPALTMPAIVSTLHGPDGDFHITEIAFAPGPELPALESLGVERCRSRAVRAQHELSTVRGTPASTCHWTDGSSHDELFVVHADRILLFEYETTTDDRSPFTRMVDETRLYPANQ